MPSKVSFQPELFYDSVMKDTFSSSLHDLFGLLYCKTQETKNQTKTNQQKNPSKFNLITCIPHFLGSTEKAER